MLNSKPSTKLMIMLIAVAVVLFGLGLFIYSSMSSKLSARRAQLEEKEMVLRDFQGVVRQLSSVEQDYIGAQTKLGVLEKGVSTKAYVPTLLRQLEEQGKNANLRVVGVRPKLPDTAGQAASSTGSNANAKPEPYETLNVEIEVNGKYWDVVRFVRALASFPKIIAVKDVQVNPVAGTAAKLGSPVLSVKLDCTAFILKESESQPKGIADMRSDLNMNTGAR